MENLAVLEVRGPARRTLLAEARRQQVHHIGQLRALTGRQMIEKARHPSRLPTLARPGKPPLLVAPAWIPA